jgi:hypothetical protein
MKISDMLLARQRAQQIGRPRRAAGSRANGGAIRRSGRKSLSAANRARLEEALAHCQRAIEALQEVLDADEAQSTVEQSWTHAPLN